MKDKDGKPLAVGDKATCTCEVEVSSRWESNIVVKRLDGSGGHMVVSESCLTKIEPEFTWLKLEDVWCNDRWRLVPSRGPACEVTQVIRSNVIEFMFYFDGTYHFCQTLEAAKAAAEKAVTRG